MATATMEVVAEDSSRLRPELPETTAPSSKSRNDTEQVQNGTPLTETLNRRSNGSSSAHDVGGDQDLDLRARFSAIETRMNMVDRLFGLQQVAAEQSPEVSDAGSDSDDSDRNFNFSLHRNFFSDSLYFMSRVRRSHERIQHYEKVRREERRKAKQAAQMNRGNKKEPESARQVSTTAFLKNEPAKVAWVDWDIFVVQKGEVEKSIMTPIDAVTGEPEPQVILQLTSRLSSLQSKAKASGNRATERPPAIDPEDAPGQGPLPERIKIHSGALYAVFSRIATDRNRIWEVASDGSMVFLRPFREFVYYEKPLRKWLADLEKRFENWDGTDTTPAPLEMDGTAEGAPSDAGGGGDEVRKTGPSDGASIQGEEGQSDDKKKDDDELTSTSISALLHLRCLMGFVDDVIKPKLEYINSDKCRKILFHDLWHLFKPGDEVVDQSEKQAYRIIRVQIPRHKVEDPWLRWYRKPSNDNEDKPKDETPVTVHCAFIDFDGKQFGPVSVKFSIPQFGGLKDIKSLPVYPFRFAKDAGLRQTLIKRGKMLLDVAKFKPMYYMGFTLDTRDEIDSQVVVDFSEALSDEKRKEWGPTIEPIRTAPDEGNDETCMAACCLNQAVRDDDYIDSSLTENFVKSLIPDTSFGAPSLILSPRHLEETSSGTEGEPTEEEFLVMAFRVFGFVLRSRKWAQLDLTFLRYENTDARASTLSAFERLELPPGHREMVKSLVTQHFRERQAAFTRDEQTDLIRGKGKGLILLLHGAPGVGKTTTAEGVAELFQKPLFQITCGDLGTTARDVETELEKNFALASRWGCILLLDEADVFLSARERKDFERNGLVAVFLRVLEYYAGILFLTTNRIGDFDEAFASRIHMSLYYPELDEGKTKKVFKLNLNLIQERFDRQGRKIIYDESSIEDFAEQHFQEHKYSRWNGRQIRNACQTALALAEFDAHDGKTHGEVDKDAVVRLQLKHFRLVQTAYLEFGRYLGDIRGTQGDRRAIDYGLRARTNTPYQTTPSRFSARADESRFSRGGHPSSSLSEAHYSSAADSFQPLVNQGYPAPQHANMRPMYGSGQYGPQGQPMAPMGNSGAGGYENQQQTFPQQGQGDGRLYPAHQAPQGPQMGFSQQSQGWGNPNMGMNYNAAGQSPQGNPLQGQQQYGYSNVQQVGAQQSLPQDMQQGGSQQTAAIPQVDNSLQGSQPRSGAGPGAGFQ